MILLILLSTPGHAVEREAVLQHAAEFATHIWTMGTENQRASCETDYISDYTPGVTYQGIPYDWGGWYTPEEFDHYLEEGYAAGSHSWHGSLWCTVGVDCSGFLSQVWETEHKYGTSTFHEVTEEIAVTDLVRGDGMNDAGSHCVLFAYETAAGIPVHYEAAGDLVFVDSDQGWSGFSSYVGIRYEAIEDGQETGTVGEPILIEAFPYEDLRWTAGRLRT